MAKKENWREIEGYEGIYAVSNYGNVKTIKTGDMKAQTMGNHGYKVVTLSKNGKSKTFLVHRLVGNTFVKNPDNKELLDHIDMNKTNNHYTNLRFCNKSENSMNRNAPANNKSGVRGVYFSNSKNRWVAQIKLNQKNIYIGQFKTIEEATEAREKKEAELFKEFAPNN